MNVLQLPFCKVDSFGGVQSFVRTLVREAQTHGSQDLKLIQPCPTWYAEAFGMGSDGLENALRALYQQYSINIVHTHNLNLDLPAADVIDRLGRELRIPHVLTIHDIPDDVGQHSSALSGLSNTVFVTQSQYNMCRCRSLLQVEATLLPVGISFDEFVPSNDYDDRTIAYPGRFARNKGALQALTVVGEVSKQLGSLRLLLSDPRRNSYGQKPEYFAEIDQLQSAYPEVRLEFFEDCGEVTGLYHQAALTMSLPQRAEGFGLTCLESLACGRPVVAVPTGGMIEWLTCLPGVRTLSNCNASQIAAALIDVIRCIPLFHEAARSARKKLRQTFGSEAVLRAHEELYQSILRGVALGNR